MDCAGDPGRSQVRRGTGSRSAQLRPRPGFAGGRRRPPRGTTTTSGGNLPAPDGFDLIVSCTPGYRSDAMAVVSATDVAVVVATRGRTGFRDARRTAELLGHTGVRVSGAIPLGRNGLSRRPPARLAPLTGPDQDSGLPECARARRSPGCGAVPGRADRPSASPPGHGEKRRQGLVRPRVRAVSIRSGLPGDEDRLGDFEAKERRRLLRRARRARPPQILAAG